MQAFPYLNSGVDYVGYGPMTAAGKTCFFLDIGVVFGGSNGESNSPDSASHCWHLGIGCY